MATAYRSGRDAERRGIAFTLMPGSYCLGCYVHELAPHFNELMLADDFNVLDELKPEFFVVAFQVAVSMEFNGGGTYALRMLHQCLDNCRGYSRAPIRLADRHSGHGRGTVLFYR